MPRVTVQAGKTLPETYVRTPQVGLCELVWNACDEDASLVTIAAEPNVLGGIEKICVTDNGNGMTLEPANLAFSRVGDSWKLMPGTLSKGGKQRPVHGRFGRGLYSAFSLGERVRWTSVSEAVTGDLQTVVVSGTRSGLDGFEVDVEPDHGNHCDHCLGAGGCRTSL